MVFLPVPVSTLMHYRCTFLSNLFAYKKTVDFAASRPNCEHPIKGYAVKILKVLSDGSFVLIKEIKKSVEKFDIFLSEPGLYQAIGTVTVACPTLHPNVGEKKVTFEVTSDDLAIKKISKRYWKESEPAISFIIKVYTLAKMIIDIIKIIIARLLHYTRIRYEQFSPVG